MCASDKRKKSDSSWFARIPSASALHVAMYGGLTKVPQSSQSGDQRSDQPHLALSGSFWGVQCVGMGRNLNTRKRAFCLSLAAAKGYVHSFLQWLDCTRWAGRSQALAAQTPLLSEICGAVEKGNSIELVNEMIHSSLKSWFNDWVSDRIDKRPVAVGV